MNLIPWNIVRKDFRLTRIYLVAWWAVLAFGAMLTIWNLHQILQDPQVFAEVAHRDFILDYVSYNANEFPYLANWLIMALDAVLLAIIVDLIFKADSPIDELAVWRTRPISGLGVLRAKLLFLALFCFLVPGTIQTAEYIYLGSDWVTCLHALARFFVLQSVFVAVIASAAVLFRRTFSGLLVFCGLALGSIMVGLANPSPSFTLEKLTASFHDGLPNAWATLIVLSLTGLAVAAIMYARHSRTAGAKGLGIGGLAALLTCFIGLNYSSSQTTGTPQLDDRIQVSFASHPVSGIGGGRNTDQTRLELAVNVTLRDAPGTVLHVTGIRSRLDWPGSKLASVYTHQSGSDWINAPGLFNLPSALAAAGYGRLLDDPYAQSFAADILQLSKEQIAQAAAQPAHWQGTLTGEVGRLVVDWDVPFANGTTWAHNQSVFKLEVQRNVFSDVNSWQYLAYGEFLFWETSPTNMPWMAAPPADNGPRIILLYNPAKKEAVRGWGGASFLKPTRDQLSIYYIISSYNISFALDVIFGVNYPIEPNQALEDIERKYNQDMDSKNDDLASQDKAAGVAAIRTWQQDKLAFLQQHRQEMADWLAGARLVELRFVPDHPVYNTVTINSVQIITPDISRAARVANP